ncbi:Gfo/Idh/MocA family protein [Streptomyces profundus]|uniref:Gfo/Idh/MocA family protein n=1 Tax=Streptomyces profundus TaxID=2867410 RepID=UPI001D165200|nr:Gfo/Idh/MocA family oxidoreductase [Streptomyces sp. MA3_2.13]UED85447.1 Gfo/Idh/MocA family oxidoreductase [Streptomyces sp. MA3_2.13]
MSTTETEREPLRVGLIGLGVISKFYVAAFDELPDVELVAVCDLRPAALDPFRPRMPVHTDHRQLLATPGLDAVVVNVPNDVHHAVCADAVAAGVAVCVEKPLTTRVADGRALVAAARDAGVVLFTSFHRRYNDNALALLERLPADVPVTSLTVRYLERIEEHAGDDRWYLDPERCGGGCVADNGPNAFDTARQFLGALSLVEAKVLRDAEGVDRQATVELRAASGATARIELDWAYPGERKDIEVHLADGTVHHADMLGGHDGFKRSLWHEYVGVLTEFAAAVRAGRGHGEEGLAALELVDRVYRSQGAPSTAVPGPDPSEDGLKFPVRSTLVKILTHRRDDRGMSLTEFASRCVRRGEVHELVTTDQLDPTPGAVVDRVGFLGFVEIESAGVLDRGDEVWADGRRIGAVLGFDDCHFPNHYNVLIAVDTPTTGPEQGLVPGMEVRFGGPN